MILPWKIIAIMQRSEIAKDALRFAPAVKPARPAVSFQQGEASEKTASSSVPVARWWPSAAPGRRIASGNGGTPA